MKIIINKKTNESFISAEEKKDYDMNGKPRHSVILKREDGTTKEVSMTSFRSAYVETEVEDEPETMPMPGTEDPEWGDKARGLTAHQKTAKKQLENAYDWIVGALENDVQDGNADEMPPVDQMFEEVMSEATTHLYGEGSCSHKAAPAAMQFAGKKFLINTLVYLFESNGYEVPEELKRVPEKKHTSTREYKDTPDHVGEDEVVMRAFTGMLIGVFKIFKQTKTHIQVVLADGTILKFNRKTGIQDGAKNPKFANRIEV